MAFMVVLENSRHEALEETSEGPHQLLHPLLPRQDDESFQCLRFIDWYGDTIFNRIQMDPFLAELERIRRKASRADEHELLDRIRDLGLRCRDRPHRYLKFRGD